MVKRNFWIDAKRRDQTPTQKDSWITGTVTEQVEDGQLAVALDGAPDDWPDVVAPADGGMFAIGAGVRLLRDSTGRVVQIATPESLPDDATPFPVGSMGEYVDRIRAAQAELDTAMQALDAEVESAQSDAQQAANDATASLVAASEAASDARAALDDAVLRIDSSRGTAFKNNAISTVLSVTIIRGGELITDIETLWDVYGTRAYLEWWWRRLNDDGFGVISSADSRLSNAGFALTISPADVDGQTVFQCILHT